MVSPGTAAGSVCTLRESGLYGSSSSRGEWDCWLAAANYASARGHRCARVRQPGSGGRRPVVLPSGFQESVVFSGLTNPTALRFAPDGRVFVAEKSGLIKVFDSLADTTPTVFADLRDQRLQLLGPRPARPGARPELPGQPVRLRALHATTRRSAASRRAGARPACTRTRARRRPARPATAAWSRGRLSRLQAAGNVDDRSRAGAHRGLVPAVPEPLDRRRSPSAPTARST